MNFDLPAGFLYGLTLYVFLSFPNVILLLLAMISYILFFVFFKEQHCDKSKDRPTRTFWNERPLYVLLFKDRGRVVEKNNKFFIFSDKCSKICHCELGCCVNGDHHVFAEKPG